MIRSFGFWSAVCFWFATLLLVLTICLFWTLLDTSWWSTSYFCNSATYFPDHTKTILLSETGKLIMFSSTSATARSWLKFALEQPYYVLDPFGTVVILKSQGRNIWKHTDHPKRQKTLPAHTLILMKMLRPLICEEWGSHWLGFNT